jgi:hypothetical protein
MESNKKYRFEDNPDEKIFYDNFIKMFNKDMRAKAALSGIIFGWTNNKQYYPKEYLTVREKNVCVNLIQWLGFSVGQGFLRDCGFEKVK